MLTPLEFGLPPKFTCWRPGQIDFLSRVCDDPSRFIALCAPTGFGKSLAVMAAAHMSGSRAVILTSTKGLQDQYVRDFSSIAADIRGKTNYRCPAATSLGYPDYTVVADAPCQGGYNCPLRGGGCDYYDRYRTAQRANIVTTNYACWFYDAQRTDKLTSVREVDILVLDEAHDAPEQLAGYLGVEIEHKECNQLQIEWPNPAEMDFDKWRRWASKWLAYCTSEMEECRDHRKGILWRKVGRKLARVVAMSNPESWVIDPKFGIRDKVYPLAVHFDPLWVQPYAESALFRDVKKVVLVSATVRPKTLELLGIGTSSIEGKSAFIEYPSSFPIKRRPTIHVPTVQMNYRNENDDYKLGTWLSKIDYILDQRPDRKGIIHAVSYQRARLIYDNSRHSSRMLIHGSDNTRQVIENFKKSSAPSVLISPSVTTGYDFPYEECEFQIIGKLPFPPMQDKVVKARSSQDKDYVPYIVMQILVQMVGRGMRAEDDQCETLIIDDNVLWFMRQNKLKFSPKWFRDAYLEGDKVPDPLPKLQIYSACSRS